MASTVLIIGHPGRLRDGLRTVLLAFEGINEVAAIADFATARDLITLNQPSLIIVDGSCTIEDECKLLKQLLLLGQQKPFIVIVNTLEQRRQATNVGVDAVLMQGFSTTTLRKALVKLSILVESVAVQTEGVVQVLPVTAVPQSQTILPL